MLEIVYSLNILVMDNSFLYLLIIEKNLKYFILIRILMEIIVYYLIFDNEGILFISNCFNIINLFRFLLMNFNLNKNLILILLDELN